MVDTKLRDEIKAAKQAMAAEALAQKSRQVTEIVRGDPLTDADYPQLLSQQAKAKRFSKPANYLALAYGVVLLLPISQFLGLGTSLLAEGMPAYSAAGWLYNLWPPLLAIILLSYPPHYVRKDVARWDRIQTYWMGRATGLGLAGIGAGLGLSWHNKIHPLDALARLGGFKDELLFVPWLRWPALATSLAAVLLLVVAELKLRDEAWVNRFNGWSKWAGLLFSLTLAAAAFMAVANF